MTIDEARAVLLLHGPGPNIKGRDEGDTLLDSVRFRRELREAHFLEIVRALLAISENSKEKLQIEKDVVNAVWLICDLSVSWLRKPGGVLESQSATLDEWIRVIASVFQSILQGVDEWLVFLPFATYISQGKLKSDLSEFEPLLHDALKQVLSQRNYSLSYDSWTDSEINLIKGLGLMGSLAPETVSTLQTIENSDPNEDVRKTVMNALRHLNGIH